jgi:hypothetical protein
MTRILGGEGRLLAADDGPDSLGELGRPLGMDAGGLFTDIQVIAAAP